MGVIDSALQPLPSWHAIRALSSFISGQRFLEKVTSATQILALQWRMISR
jgi:hypothetical protein